MSEPTKDLSSLTLDDLIQVGLSPLEAQIFYRQLKLAIANAGLSPSAAWRIMSKELLHPNQPHALHRLMYESIYWNWDSSKLGPPLAWFPSQESARETNLGRLMEARGKELLGPSYYSPIESFPAFQKFSAEHPDIYWPLALDELSLHFHVPPKCIFSAPDEARPGGTWLPGAVLNAAECCLLPKPSRGKTDLCKALIWRTEGQRSLQSMTLAELRVRVSRVANALDATGLQEGAAIALCMPMTASTIIVYLAIILAGYVVVSVADSFVAHEIATRLRVGNASAIFTQDHILRGGKILPLYSRIVEAKSPMAIVLPANGCSLEVTLRSGDVSWDAFLALADRVNEQWEYQAKQQPIERHTNILFSSGTSGEPKAVPYSHLQPLRLGSEGWSHLDIKAGDIFVWPTNFGWMMGPMLIYSCLLNGATVGVYNGSPVLRGFGEFIQDAGVTFLGTVPTIVKTWRKTHCMNGLDWSQIRVFCSTGETSSVDDDLWLSARSFYKPVLEACGGTELASAFLRGCVLQPQALGAFSTPTMGTTFVILDEKRHPYPQDEPCVGELALMPMLGASHTLLNADHDAIYYKGMPMYKGVQLRRHGDLFERTVGGYYRAHGRSDDTMKLGGIKVSAIEIERVCNKVNPHIIETAAIGAPPPGGGPEQLVVFSVINDTWHNATEDQLKEIFSKALQNYLNPLFKVSRVVLVSELPRTGTNKVIRRALRSQIIQETKLRSRI